jgi:DNA polymerase-3 subunit alpha
MGYIAFTYDKATKNMYYVIEFKTYKNKSKPYLTLYQVKTGETIKAKIINEEVYMSAPFKEGNVLLVDKMSKKPKSKLVNGKWVKSQTEKDNILDSYQVF